MGKSGGDSTEDCSIGLTIRRRSMAELPEPARRKLVTLMRQAEDHRALAEVERIRANGMRARVTDVRNRLAASEVESEISPELRIAEQGLQEQEMLQQTRFERYSQTQRLITQINAWLASLPPTTVLVPVTSEIRSEGNYQQQVERLRREITERKAELLKVNAARAPVEDARRQVCRLVDTLSRAPSLNTDGGKLSVPSWQSRDGV
jgi:type VI protein secretion system component VasF